MPCFHVVWIQLSFNKIIYLFLNINMNHGKVKGNYYIKQNV